MSELKIELNPPRGFEDDYKTRDANVMRVTADWPAGRSAAAWWMTTSATLVDDHHPHVGG